MAAKRTRLGATAEHPSSFRLRSVTDMTETVQCGVQEIVAAMSCGRPELLKLWRCPDEGLSKAESERLVNILRVLMQTNQELQSECRHVAAYVDCVRILAGDVENAAAAARGKAWAFKKKIGDFKFRISPDNHDQDDDAQAATAGRINDEGEVT